MKINKILLSITVVFTFFIFTPTTHAADLSVTCGDDGCSMSGTEPLFNEDNVLPGWSVKKTVKVKNEFDERREFMVEVDDLYVDENLSEVLEIVIKEDGEPGSIYGPVSLEDWEDEKDLPLSYIEAGDSTTYELIISMGTGVGNDYQGKSTEFDLKLGFDTVFAEPDVQGDSDEDDNNNETLGVGNRFFSFVGQAQGVSEEDVESEKPIVEGVQDDSELKGESKCVDPWWWFLVFFAQAGVHSIIHFVFEDDKKLLKAVFQLLIGALFVFIFWENFCPAWDYWIAGIIGLVFISLSFTERKRY